MEFSLLVVLPGCRRLIGRAPGIYRRAEGTSSPEAALEVVPFSSRPNELFGSLSVTRGSCRGSSTSRGLTLRRTFGVATARDLGKGRRP